MKYCSRCLYPQNAKPTILIDEEDGLCSGCRYHESRGKVEINWGDREKMFEKIVSEAKRMAKERKNLYDCVIPVSGGKDSQFQVWTLKEKYGLNPLLVTFNHCYNMESGLRNLESLVDKSGCDLIRFTSNVKSVKKISRFMLEEVGDLTWHYHAGIRTFPIRVAVEKNIPFIFWGEHGFGELTGIVSLEDFVEFTKWTRKQHDMRGYEPVDVINASKGKIMMEDLSPYVYPTDEEIEKTSLRGIYMSNYFYWDALSHVRFMMEKWDFAPVTFRRGRTFNLYAKIEDHANEVHDYLKFLKFGYGRATDDASMEIRHGRMTREEGIEMVKKYDRNEPTSLKVYLEFLELTKEEFYQLVEPMRDLNIWRRENGEWVLKDGVENHLVTQFTQSSKVKQSNERTFSDFNRNLYYNDLNPPVPRGDRRCDEQNLFFKIL